MIRLRESPWKVWSGVRYRFHPLFSMMMMLSLLTGYFIETLTLFAIVFIHELGHAAAAKGFGWRVREVQLLPFGGVAVVEDPGGAPVKEEVIIALAGPLQNVWMMGVGWGLTAAGVFPEDYGHYFIKANLLIALFNLLPVLPLDGGKILQAVLGLWLPYQRMLQVSAVVSLLLSGIFIAAAGLHLLTEQGGLQLNWLMLGLFLLYSNWYELKGVPYRFMRFLVHRERGAAEAREEPVRAGPIIAANHLRIAEVVKLFMRDRYHLVYVLDRTGAISGIVPEQNVLRCYFDERQRGLTVGELFA